MQLAQKNETSRPQPKKTSPVALKVQSGLRAGKIDWSGPGDEGPEESITFVWG